MTRPNKFICIHGHFYQPPRENAWLETVEQQPSARPWHDWNERISFECYAPNAAARILDSEGVISKIRNNYNRISFNFGPTLLSWLDENDPEAYKMILAADKLASWLQQNPRVLRGIDYTFAGVFSVFAAKILFTQAR